MYLGFISILETSVVPSDLLLDMSSYCLPHFIKPYLQAYNSIKSMRKVNFFSWISDHS